MEWLVIGHMGPVHAVAKDRQYLVSTGSLDKCVVMHTDKNIWFVTDTNMSNNRQTAMGIYRLLQTKPYTVPNLVMV